MLYVPTQGQNTDRVFQVYFALWIKTRSEKLEGKFHDHFTYQRLLCTEYLWKNLESCNLQHLYFRHSAIIKRKHFYILSRSWPPGLGFVFLEKYLWESKLHSASIDSLFSGPLGISKTKLSIKLLSSSIFLFSITNFWTHMEKTCCLGN